jgi:hypothetical protein
MTVYTTLFNIVQQTSLHRKSFFHKNKRKKSEYGNLSQCMKLSFIGGGKRKKPPSRLKIKLPYDQDGHFYYNIESMQQTK